MLVSVIHQHELAMGIHMSRPSWISLPPLTPSHPTPLGCHTVLVWALESYNKFPLAIYFTWGSVQFSCSVMSSSLQPHGLQYTRLPCPSPTPGTYANSCPLSKWYHLTILSSVIPFSSRPQSFQYQDLFQWVSSSYKGVKVLELLLQHQSFQWIFRTDFL